MGLDQYLRAKTKSVKQKSSRGACDELFPIAPATQFIQCVNYIDNRLIDEDTGEILCDDLTEADMRKFDGDIEEPQEIYEPEPPAVDNEIFAKLKAVLGDTFIAR